MTGFRTATGALLANNSIMGQTTNDVANANAIGGKESYGFFISLVAGAGSGFPGGGVMAKGVQNVAAQGNLQTSASATHLAISGNGFFVCSRSTKTPEIEYTRAGHFYPDKDGNLCNVAGLFLLGWQTDEAGNVPSTINKSDLSSLINMNVNRISGLAKPTENLVLGFTLPSDSVGAPVGHTETSTVSIYDSLGAKHNLTLSWTRTAITPCAWDLAITCPDGTVFQDGTLPLAAYGGATPLTVEFDGNGNPTTFGGGTQPPALQIQWDPTKTNANNSVVNLDIGEVGQSAGVTCKSGAFALTRQSQDGREFGTFRNVNIDDDGKIYAVYSNGQSIIIGRIALANFAAPDQLEAQSGNSYIETDASGTYSIAEAKSGGFGRIVSNALESSTVDIASKLTDMIELQNHYAANTKSIAAIKKEYEDLMRI